MINTQIPIPTSPFIDLHTGRVNREWYLFLNYLFQLTGTGTGGTANQVLHGNGIFSAVDPADLLHGTNGQIIVAATGAASAYRTMSGDGTLVSSGAITITKTSGVAFAASATTDTTNASNISSGTLGVSRYGPAIAWTPTDASGAGLSFSSVSSSATQLGNIVFAYATLTYPVTASGASAIIGGLPVTVANTNYAQVPSLVDTTAALSISLVPVKATTTATFNAIASLGAVTNAQLSGATVIFNIAYPVS